MLFPSGAKVEIARNYWGLDVSLFTPRAKDVNNERGLCLHNPATIDAEGMKERLEVGESFFDTLPDDVNAGYVEYARACLCPIDGQNSQTHCQNVFDAAFPTLLNTAMEDASPTELCDRQKRDIHYSDDVTDEDLQLFKHTLNAHHRFRRAVADDQIPKENATRYCAERISDTKLGKLCAQFGVNVQQLVETCSADLEFSGDLSFASGSVAVLVEQCGILGAKNLSMLANKSSEANPAAKALVEQVAELLCPNDCTLNGECVNGSCVCYKDYTASDCSVSIYQLPTISRLQEDGLCDRRKRPCKKVTVFGIT